ncbi:flagellar protein FlaG [Mesoterricola silvestris]|nr:flagellar protein FlaG [Mesoterricola silvestris]
MSDPISAAGSQGSSPPAAVYVAAQADSVQGAAKVVPSAPATISTATSKAIQEAAQTSQEATKLDLSPASGLSNKQVNPEMTMEQAAEAFQSYLKSLPSNLQFQPDYQAGIVIFRVVNPVTNKVIRQLPPEEVVQQARTLRMAEQQSHSGILLDKSL